MKILNDNTFIKVWTDGLSPILFMQLKSQFYGLIDALEVYSVSNIKPIKTMASTHKNMYLLLDVSDANCTEVESLIQYFEHTLARRIKASFRYISIVRSKSLTGLYLKGNSEIPVGVFDTFFEALGTINDMRAKECVLN